MNLQPIYPARHPSEQRLLKACMNCGKDVLTGTGFADLDGEPFKAYVCICCVPYYIPKRIAVVSALEERDRRERTFYPLRYALAGRIASPT